MVPNILDFSVSIAGPGRTARAFARSWIRSGGRLEDVVGRTAAKARRAAAEIGAGRPRAADSGRLTCDLLVVGVADDEIPTVARSLARQTSCRFAFHFSGALPAEALAPLRSSGAALGSLHPARAFSGAPSETWNDAFVAIEGDEEAVRVAELVVDALGARGRRIAADGKPLYHAAATLAAGGTLALVSMAVEAWVSLGIPDSQARAILSDLSLRAVAAAADRGFEDAFTGPVARRDVNTVRAHRAALAGRPQALTIYTALARETLRRTPGRGKDEEILAILEGRSP